MANLSVPHTQKKIVYVRKKKNLDGWKGNMYYMKMTNPLVPSTFPSIYNRNELNNVTKKNV